MEQLLTDLVSNKVQIFLTAGLRKYMTVARFLKAITNALIIFGLSLIGILLGFLLIIIPLFVQPADSPINFWAVFVGTAIVSTFGGFLYFWNSEKAWTRRLQIQSALKRIGRIQ